MTHEGMLPVGWRRATYGEEATHALCQCRRRELVAVEADSHACSWVLLVLEEATVLVEEKGA